MPETQALVTGPGGAQIGVSQVTWAGSTGDLEGITTRDPVTGAGAAVTASNALKVDGSAVTQPISASSLPLPTNAAADGVDGTGITAPTGGSGIRGWLSGIFNQLKSGTISIGGSIGLLAQTANGLKVDGSAVTQPISAASLPLPTNAAQDGTDGASAPTITSGGTGIRGWLSTMAKYMSQALIGGTNEDSVSVGGLNTTLTNLSTATSSTPLYPKASAGRVCRIVNTATSSTTTGVTVFILNQASGAAVTANIVYSFTQMAAGQIIDLQIPCGTGIGIYQSGGTLASGNIALTWS